MIMTPLTLICLEPHLDQVHRHGQGQLGRPRHAAGGEHGEQAGPGHVGGGEAVQGPGVHTEEDGVNGANSVDRVREAPHQGLEAILCEGCV